MAKKSKPVQCPKCMPQWLAAFGDLMSLLLCFFVLLLSMSSMDAKKIEDAIGSLAGALSVLDGGSKSQLNREQQQQDNPVQKGKRSAGSNLDKLKKQLSELNQMSKASTTQKANLQESQDGFIIDLPASLLFKEGSADITNEDALLFLKRIALIIKRMPKNIMIDVVGHTNDNAPATDKYANNWQLSTSRAISVVEELIKDKVEASRLKASGRAEFAPINSNATKEGKIKNSRVEIKFVSLQSKHEKEIKKSILDVTKGSK